MVACLGSLLAHLFGWYRAEQVPVVPIISFKMTVNDEKVVHNSWYLCEKSRKVTSLTAWTWTQPCQKITSILSSSPWQKPGCIRTFDRGPFIKRMPLSVLFPFMLERSITKSPISWLTRPIKVGGLAKKQLKFVSLIWKSITELNKFLSLSNQIITRLIAFGRV